MVPIGILNEPAAPYSPFPPILSVHPFPTLNTEPVYSDIAPPHPKLAFAHKAGSLFLILDPRLNRPRIWKLGQRITALVEVTYRHSTCRHDQTCNLQPATRTFAIGKLGIVACLGGRKVERKGRKTKSYQPCRGGFNCDVTKDLW